jgi:hypothetical protein
MCFVSVYENRKIKAFEVVLRRGRRENKGGGKSN